MGHGPWSIRDRGPLSHPSRRGRLIHVDRSGVLGTDCCFDLTVRFILIVKFAAMRCRFKNLACGFLIAITALTFSGHAYGQLAVRASKVLPIAGDPIENGVVLIKQGKIEAVGKDLKIPVEYKVIEVEQGVVMPGLVDPHNSDAMSQANEQNTNVPFLSVVDSIDPNSSYFEQSRRNGVTTAAVVPGNSTMIGGRSAIIKTAGAYVDDMLLVRDAGLKISLRPIRGSRMSHLARLRRELDVAKRAIEEEDEAKATEAAKEKADKKKPDDGEDPKDKDQEDKPQDDEKQDDGKDEDAKDEDGDSGKSDAAAEKPEEEEAESLKQLKRLLRGKQPAFVYCDRAMDVPQALTLAEEYGFEARLVLSQDCYKAAELLHERQQPVILDPQLVFWETDARTREDYKVVIPKIFADAGVPFLFQANLGSSPRSVGSGYFWYQAATSVAYGLPESTALQRLTLEPAKLLGVDEFVGSIEPGKDADLVIFSGDPLAIDSWVLKTIIGGEVVYERETDDKLKKLLEDPQS